MLEIMDLGGQNSTHPMKLVNQYRTKYTNLRGGEGLETKRRVNKEASSDKQKHRSKAKKAE
jgi:hypothetical protein